MNSEKMERMDVDSPSDHNEEDSFNPQASYMKHFKVKQESRKKRRGEHNLSNYNNRRHSLPIFEGGEDVRAMQNHFKLVPPSVAKKGSIRRGRSKSVDFTNLPIKPSKRRLSTQYVVNISTLPMNHYDNRWTSPSYMGDPKIRKFTKLVEAAVEAQQGISMDIENIMS